MANFSYPQPNQINQNDILKNNRKSIMRGDKIQLRERKSTHLVDIASLVEFENAVGYGNIIAGQRVSEAAAGRESINPKETRRVPSQF